MSVCDCTHGSMGTPCSQCDHVHVHPIGSSCSSWRQEKREKDPRRFLIHHIATTSSSAPSFALCMDRRVQGPSSPEWDAACHLCDVILKLQALPRDTTVTDCRVQDLLNAPRTNEALGVLAGQRVSPQSHFPGPLVTFRDMIISIRQAYADQIGNS